MTDILLKLVLVVGLLAGCFIGGCHHGEASARAEQQAANDARREEVAMIDKAQAARTQEADRAQERKHQRQAVADAALRSELDRLRKLADDRNLPGAARDPRLAAYATDGDGLLAECAERYSAVARDAASLADRLGGLQSLVQPQPLKE